MKYMRKTPIDKTIIDILRSVHKDFPRLTEQDVESIYDLLSSEDTEIKMTGVLLLDTFNYFDTPETIMYLYSISDITIEIDTDDVFVGMIKTLYFDSERYMEVSTQEMRDYDLKLKYICEKKRQEK